MELRIEENDSGKLLRDFLRERGVSAALLAKLKRHERGILLGGERVTVRAVLRAGDLLTLAVEDEGEGSVVPRELPIDVLVRTSDFAVLNKSADMPTHPSHGHFEDTLANALAYHFAKDGVPFRPRFINRLDRNTTGAVLVAMHPLAAATLSRAMASGEIEKTYLAIAHGEMTEPRVIRTGIRRHSQSIILREVCDVSEGDFAETLVQPLAAGEGLTLLRLTPRTGRTHQLRVHMAHIGHPLLGDELYGTADGFARHALHAATLAFPSPLDGTRVAVFAPLADDMRAICAQMGWEVTP